MKKLEPAIIRTSQRNVYNLPQLKQALNTVMRVETYVFKIL